MDPANIDGAICERMARWTVAEHALRETLNH